VGCVQAGVSLGTVAFSLVPIAMYGLFTVIRQNVTLPSPCMRG
jgi:hypothetical protein